MVSIANPDLSDQDVQIASDQHFPIYQGLLINRYRLGYMQNIPSAFPSTVWETSLVTYSGKLTLSRREIIDHAKQLVLTYGPDNLLDHPEECVMATHRYDEDFPVTEVAREAERQARRVYEFLGYSTPY